VQEQVDPWEAVAGQGCRLGAAGPVCRWARAQPSVWLAPGYRLEGARWASAERRDGWDWGIGRIRYGVGAWGLGRCRGGRGLPGQGQVATSDHSQHHDCQDAGDEGPFSHNAGSSWDVSWGSCSSTGTMRRIFSGLSTRSM
jgi:hypothetical protein